MLFYDSLIWRLINFPTLRLNCNFSCLWESLNKTLNWCLMLPFFPIILVNVRVYNVVMGGVIINLLTPFFSSWFTIYVHLLLMRWLEWNQIRFNLQLNCEVIFPPQWGCKTTIKLKLLCVSFFLFGFFFFFLTSIFYNYKTSHLFEHGKCWHLVCSYF